METLFWGSLFAALYSYFFYPLLLVLLPRHTPVPGRSSSYLPDISVIIAARNEAARIEAKLANTLACAYPRDRLEIIVASDASDDDTDRIVEAYQAHGVRLVRSPTRKGKEHAQGLAIGAARGEVLVFTDCSTELETEGLSALVHPFTDPEVGAVSSEDRFLDREGRVVGEGAYVRYEMWLRRRESGVGGLVGLSGSLFAARREVCKHWDSSIPSDFQVAGNCVRLGLRAVVAPAARGWYRDLSGGSEYGRKYRTVLRGMTGLLRNRDLLNPASHGLFALQLFSHKLMRWMVPVFLFTLAMTSPFMLGKGLWPELVIGAELVFYAMASIGLLRPRLRRYAWIRLPAFFLQVNAAIAHALIAFVLGQRITAWEPSRR